MSRSAFRGTHPASSNSVIFPSTQLFRIVLWSYVPSLDKVELGYNPTYTVSRITVSNWCKHKSNQLPGSVVSWMSNATLVGPSKCELPSPVWLELRSCSSRLWQYPQFGDCQSVTLVIIHLKWISVVGMACTGLMRYNQRSAYCNTYCKSFWNTSRDELRE